MPSIWRLSYAKTKPFSRSVTIILSVLYLLGFSGLLVFNFLTQAKSLRCTSYASGDYSAESCEPTPLEFARTYYTRPVAHGQHKGQSGTFPWTPLGFGQSGDSGPLDYSILTSNWTAQALNCTMFEQILTLHLDSGGWTVASCYYCGSALRVLCTAVDSERTQLAGDPATQKVDLGNLFTNYRNQIQAIATSTYEGGIILASRIITTRALPTDIVQPGVLPHNVSSSSVVLGTTIGSSVVFANSSNTALAAVAVTGLSIGTLAEQATSQDLESTDNPRTLQASYICKQCQRHYKPTLEIFAVVSAAIFAVLTPAFAALRIIAELLAANDDEDHAYRPPPLQRAASKPQMSSNMSYGQGVPSLAYAPDPNASPPQTFNYR